jgi:hypothetical protein
VNVDSILISEYASVTDGACLTVFKTINQILAKKLPAQCGMMFVSLILHGHPSEGGSEHEVETRLLNSSREAVLTLTKGFSFSTVEPPSGLPIRQVFIQGFVNLEFQEAGPYAFEVYIDGTYHAGAAFYVGLKED